MKLLYCRDLGFDCDGVVRADTEDEVLQRAARHAEAEHNITMTPELAAQARTLIRDET